MPLLFIDMLGVRARWNAEGRAGAVRAFSQFRSVITEAIQTRKRGTILRGGIESDSAAIICPSLRVAVDIGRRAFRIAFGRARSPNDERLWLRGVIVAGNDEEQFRREQPLAQGLEQVRVAEYSPSLLEAISAEKAGFKGMRLL